MAVENRCGLGVRRVDKYSQSHIWTDDGRTLGRESKSQRRVHINNRLSKRTQRYTDTALARYEIHGWPIYIGEEQVLQP
jgi:hypothetical protein